MDSLACQRDRVVSCPPTKIFDALDSGVIRQKSLPKETSTMLVKISSACSGVWLRHGDSS